MGNVVGRQRWPVAGPLFDILLSPRRALSEVWRVAVARILVGDHLTREVAPCRSSNLVCNLQNGRKPSAGD